MAIQPIEEQTRKFAQGKDQDTASEKVFAFTYGPAFLDELGALSQKKETYDVVIVDATKSGFLFTTEVLLESARHARNLLTVQGALLFVKQDKAVALVRETVMGSLSLHIFDRLAELYDYSPSLAQLIQTILGSAAGILEESTDLADQVLMSSIPVLTSFGIKLKGGVESHRRRNLVLGAIDNYTPLSTISQRLTVDGTMNLDELVEELRSLEQVRAIFPIFPKVPFLVHCFRNKIPFKFSEYLTSSRLLSQDQLDELLFEQQNSRGKTRLNLGALAVAKTYLSTRQLEIALQDQAFYGQGGEADKVKIVANSSEQSQVQSLVGHLGTTDPSGVLQSLANNRESGVLSVEYKGQQFRALFEQGKLTHAKLGKIKSDDAVVEFVSVWREGIFVFIQRQPPPDLSDTACQLTKPLDKLLLDGALATDNVEVVWKKLPKGANSPLEKMPDSQNLLQGSNLQDPQTKTPCTAEEIETMRLLWKDLDGLTPISKTIDNLETITTYQAAMAVDRLLHYGLVSAPQMGIAGPLEKFQEIAHLAQEKIGLDRNFVLLRLGLQGTQGYSVKTRMFSIGTAGEIGVDLAAARQAGLSLSLVIKNLEDWQVKYIEYLSHELDRDTLRSIVFTVHKDQ
jgi:hypothetical protein